MSIRYLGCLFAVLALASCATPQQKLMQATASGNEAEMTGAMQKGVDVNAPLVSAHPDPQCPDSHLPLQLAACRDHTGAVKVLLLNKADPNLAGTGDAPLVQASSKGNRDVVRLLLDAGAKPNQQSAGHTALMSASDAEIVRMLLAANADPELADGSGDTPLIQASRKGSQDIVRQLLSAGANPNAARTGGQRPLMYAADAEIAKTLLTAKADLQAQDDQGNNALMHAAENGQADVARILIRQGTDVRVKNTAGATALDLAKDEATRIPVREEYERVVHMDMDMNLAAADRAAAAGDVSSALDSYLAVLAQAGLLGKGPENDIRIRFMKTAAEWPTPPSLPEAAREHVMRADALLKRGRSSTEVEGELQQAIELAPWWAEGYFNLGLVQGGGEHYKAAIDTLRLFIAGAPNSPGVQAAKARIIDFTIGQEEVDKVLGLAGSWSSSAGGYTVGVAGDQLTFTSSHGHTIKASLKDGRLEGSLESKPYLGENRCMIPGQLHPVTGSISSDGKSMSLEYLWSTYSTRAHCVDMFGNATFCCLLCSKVCDGVTINSTTTQNETLRR